MSGKLMGRVFGLVLSRPEREMMLALADHASDDGTRVRPSVGFLAWKTDYSERQVKRLLKTLRDKQLIIPVAYARGGQGHATEYRIDLSKATPKSPYERRAKGDTQMSSFVESKSDKTKAERVTSKAIKHDTQMSPQPSIEPSIKPSFNSAPNRQRKKHSPEIALPDEMRRLTAEFVKLAQNEAEKLCAGCRISNLARLHNRFVNYADQKERVERNWRAAWRSWIAFALDKGEAIIRRPDEIDESDDDSEDLQQYIDAERARQRQEQEEQAKAKNLKSE